MAPGGSDLFQSISSWAILIIRQQRDEGGRCWRPSDRIPELPLSQHRVIVNTTLGANKWHIKVFPAIIDGV